MALKILTKEQKARFDRFYSIYPRKKSPGDAQKAWGQVDPDEDLTRKIILAIEAQKKAYKQQLDANNNPPAWKYPASWLRAMCWEDHIEWVSGPGHHESSPLDQCKCGRNVIGPRFTQCAECYSKENGNHMDTLRKHYVKNDLAKHADETQKEYMERVREVRAMLLKRWAAKQQGVKQ